jgi:hypothetical protein
MSRHEAVSIKDVLKLKSAIKLCRLLAGPLPRV